MKSVGLFSALALALSFVTTSAFAQFPVQQYFCELQGCAKGDFGFFAQGRNAEEAVKVCKERLVQISSGKQLKGLVAQGPGTKTEKKILVENSQEQTKGCQVKGAEIFSNEKHSGKLGFGGILSQGKTYLCSLVSCTLNDTNSNGIWAHARTPQEAKKVCGERLRDFKSGATSGFFGMFGKPQQTKTEKRILKQVYGANYKGCKIGDVAEGTGGLMFNAGGY